MLSEKHQEIIDFFNSSKAGHRRTFVYLMLCYKPLDAKRIQVLFENFYKSNKKTKTNLKSLADIYNVHKLLSEMEKIDIVSSTSQENIIVPSKEDSDKIRQRARWALLDPNLSDSRRKEFENITNHKENLIVLEPQTAKNSKYHRELVQRRNHKKSMNRTFYTVKFEVLMEIVQALANNHKIGITISNPPKETFENTPDIIVQKYHEQNTKKKDQILSEEDILKVKFPDYVDSIEKIIDEKKFDFLTILIFHKYLLDTLVFKNNQEKYMNLRTLFTEAIAQYAILERD